MKNILRPVLVLFAALTVVTGLAYPIVVTAVAHAAFPSQANGSLIEKNGKPVGSELLGQQFDAPGYFWGRLSATSPNPYNPQSSGASNLGPTNPALADEVKGRISALHDADPTNTAPIPVDLVTSSGSGLDPEISPAAAAYQIDRVAKARKLSHNDVDALVQRATSGRQFGILGEARVNVLKLNLALDEMKPAS
ncbi:Potassium-transporting ATPase KdpC subunit (plasmid) [Caballeronia sp. SBC1]|uniref:potassium-transporting ATPase subunit KdpC n=1 Tax=unclassified Caballeronia TaxID=2646786 RepID=UPI0013E19703|nr:MULTISPECIES: potassium-transporting ATPase subunit KdpC [unclassified Caballeronia]QIE27372.1 Potassium-transporting ATPase KdpC subunit [Caballeronia sp. SBC2]QIN65147.1 Potassium-transporting ATPase KdpC subunit [Caballeronia sp. SBC1]